MINDTFANRLQKALDKNRMKPIELSAKTGIDKSLISNYLSGNYKAKQDKLTILAKALNVNEIWLMGYDVPEDPNYEDAVYLENEHKFLFRFNEENELDILFSKYKDILTDDDKEYIKFIIEKRKKEIDKQLGEED